MRLLGRTGHARPGKALSVALCLLSMGVLALPLLFQPSVQGAPAWEPVPPMNTGRSHFAAATSHGRVFAIGGISGLSDDGTVSTIESYRPGSPGGWSLSENTMAQPRSHLAAVASDGKIYAIGGRVWPEATAAVEIYDPGTDSWQTAASMLTARAGLAAAIGPDGHVYAMGGTLKGHKR